MAETQSKGVTISGKNLTVWIVIITIVVGSIVDSALTRAQVQRHEVLLNENNLPVIVVNQQNIADDVSEMKDDLKALADSWNEYMRSH